MERGDLVIERKLCPLDRLFSGTKAADRVFIAKIVLNTKMVLPVVEVDGTVQCQGVEETLDQVGHDIGFVVLEVGLESLGLEAAHAESLVEDKEELTDGSKLPHLVKTLCDRVKFDHGWRRRG